MDTVSFFKTILPRQGLIILANIFTEEDHTDHSAYSTPEEAAEAVAELDKTDGQVYHACGTAVEWKGNIGTRVAENMGWQRSLRIDIDIHPGDDKYYQSAKEALSAVLSACKTLEFPQPLVIHSGGGIHAYWPFTDDVTTAEWRPVAQAFKRALREMGVKQDPKVTADASRVLRSPGSSWKKAEPFRTVKRLGANPVVEMGFSETKEKLSQWMQEAPAFDVPDHIRAMFGVGNDLASQEYPPASAQIIVHKCSTLAYVAEQRGDVNEPLWRGMLGLVKHTIEGEQLAHNWSTGYSDYDEGETQSKLDRWAMGPTTCEYFRDCDDSRCAGCAQKCTSPISLGYSEEVNTPIQVPEDTASDDVVADALPKAFPTRFNVSGTILQAWQSNGEEDGKWVNFCDTNFYPIEGIRQEDGTWMVRFEVQEASGKTRQFNIPAQAMAEQQGLATALGSYKVWIYGQKGKLYAMDYARRYYENLASTPGFETCTYDAFGWHDNFDAFVIGDRAITVDDEKPIRCGDALRSGGMAKHYGAEGVDHDWINLVDKIYNRPGAEAWQFAFLIAAASPLIALANIDSFNGIPIAYTGDGGVGKSTLCRMACGIWGHGKLFLGDKSERGTTMNALMKRVALHKNIPYILDEMSMHEAQHMGGLMYSLSTGTARDALDSKGNFRNGDLRWQMFTFITSNDYLMEVLASLPKTVAEATMLRVFEIRMTEAEMALVFPDLAEIKQLIDGHLQNQYGVVGRDIIRYYMKNRKKLRMMIHKMRDEFGTSTAEETKERFYIDALILALAAGVVMQKLGLIKFDLAAVRRWGKAQIKELRGVRSDRKYTDDELIGQYISSLHNRMIVTKTLANRSHTSEDPLYPLRTGEEICGRIATTEKKIIVTAKSINDWCKANNVQPTKLREMLDTHGYITHIAGRETSGLYVTRIGAGSTVATGTARCYELDYAKVYGLQTATTSNVVQLVADSVAGTAFGTTEEVAAAS